MMNSFCGYVRGGLICTALLLLFPSILSAQQRGQWFPGQHELDGGTVPDPGLTFINLTIRYSADELNQSANGHSASWANESLIFFVPKRHFLGGYYAPLLITVAANAEFEADLAGRNLIKAGGAGFTDLIVSPINMGWRFDHWDLNLGYSFVAPTGRFKPGATDNMGSGYWGNDITGATAVYLTKDKQTSAHLLANWETHGKMRGSGITPGQALTMEWGLGRIFSLRKDHSQMFQLGLIGYDQSQLTANGGSTAAAPFYSVHAMGFQTNFILPRKNLVFLFKFENEYEAEARPQGRVATFGVVWTWRMWGAEQHKN